MTSRSREEGKKYVLDMVKEHGVKFITLWFADILGFLKSFTITVEELEGALEDGMGFDGSSIEGLPALTRAIWWLYPTPIPSSCSPGDPMSTL